MYRYINLDDSDTTKKLYQQYRCFKIQKKMKQKKINNRKKNINVILYQTKLDALVRQNIMSYI